MTVYIIIITYNGIKWIEKCLKSCENYNVIVVDNASNDETVSHIKDNYPEVDILELKKNLGFGAANNKGISHALKAGADYVLLLNQDAYLESGTIKKLIEVHKSHTAFGVISPIHLNGLANKLDSGFSNYITYDNNNFLYFDAIKGRLSDIYEVPFVNAACWLLPKSTLRKIGGFDPVFFHYGEDVNYCQRLKYHGLKVGVVPNAFVLHDRELVKKEAHKKNNSRPDLFYILKWTDINIENNVEERVSQLKHTRFLSVLKFNFFKVKYCNEQLKLINSKVHDINNSRKVNKTLGMHYI
ncbi:hypothetical protein GCM10023311_02670 [Flaviramulus aquimarinus]|uniref:Glycosyltransferase 2-like domain-containing protein n=1 Tax=Flaviramulus aquimarinus TaxID=1170456 RepID=A0ABP9EYB9_9FLAO